MDAAVIGLISLCVTSVTALGLAFIAYKTTALNRIESKVDAVKEQTDGITSALVQSTAKASHAEGKAEGVAEERAIEAVPSTAPPR